MRWLILIAVAMVAVVLVVVLVGLMLPRSHRVTRMARFGQTPEAIFAAVIGPQDWRGVTVTELASDGGARRWREQSGHRSITFEEAASDRPRLYRSRIADKNLPFSGTWTWEITATADGCICRITEEAEISNPAYRFMGQLIFGYTRTIDDYLNALGKKFNEPVKIEG
jgi:hypothetical protein